MEHYPSKFSADYLTENSSWKCHVSMELPNIIPPIHIAPRDHRRQVETAGPLLKHSSGCAVLLKLLACNFTAAISKRQQALLVAFNCFKSSASSLKEQATWQSLIKTLTEGLEEFVAVKAKPHRRTSREEQ